MLFDGQVHGGIVQGAGQILMENIHYDSESGQLLSGSFMDYAIPRTDCLPNFELDNIMHQVSGEPLTLLIGFLVSMATGLFVLGLLFKILQTNRLWMFSYYCIFIWLIILFIL